MSGYVRINYANTPVGSHGSDATISAATEIAVPAGANAMQLQATGQNVRYTVDGTTPSASVGFVLVADADAVFVPANDGMTIRVIEVSAGGAIQWQAWAL